MFLKLLINEIILGKGFSISFDGIRVYITLEEFYKNRTIGLCGAFNLNSNDDFYTPNQMVETSVVTFSDYYKINPNLATPSQIAPCDLMITVNTIFVVISCSRNSFLFIFASLQIIPQFIQLEELNLLVFLGLI